jgi:hypothetical protein
MMAKKSKKKTPNIVWDRKKFPGYVYSRGRVYQKADPKLGRSFAGPFSLKYAHAHPLDKGEPENDSSDEEEEDDE